MRKNNVERLERRTFFAAGAVDLSFGSAGSVLAAHNAATSFNDVETLSDGRILAVGSGNGDFALARYNSNGTLDSTFGRGDGYAFLDGFGRADTARSLAVLADGKFLVGGTAAASDGTRMLVARFNANGTLDTTFGTAGRAWARVSAGDSFGGFAVQGDGKIVVTGDVTSLNNATGRDIAVLRFNVNGTIDTSFGGGDGIVTLDPMSWDGWSWIDDHATDVAIQSTGRIVVISDQPGEQGWLLTGLTSDGALDSAFSANGVAASPYQYDWFVSDPDLLVAPDDGLIIATTFGNSYRPFFGTFRVLPNGGRDNAWGEDHGPDTSGYNQPKFDADYAWSTDLTLTPGGKLIQAGCINGMFAAVCYDLVTGDLDTSFGAGGITYASLGGTTDMPDSANAIAMTPDGTRFVLAGTFADGYQAALTQFSLTDTYPAPHAWPIITLDAASVTVNSDRVLHIVGTDGDDVLSIEFNAERSEWAILAPGGGFYTSDLYFYVSSVLINGLGGNDRITVADVTAIPISISGGAGNDTIIGGPGNDSISGNSGKDSIDGGGGDDRLAGNGGNDRILGNSGADRMYGDAGTDILESGAGNDRIYAGADNDVLGGGSGSDILYGQAGTDTISGGGGTSDHAYDATSSETVYGIAAPITTSSFFTASTFFTTSDARSKDDLLGAAAALL